MPQLDPDMKAMMAVQLKVPCSDIPELNDMIRESRRLDMATAAMQGLMGRSWDVSNMTGEELFLTWAKSAVMCSDALLAASAKEK